MNYLQTVNKVMRRMREAEVASVSESDYSTLVGDFVQQALSEVEDARNWNALRTTIQVDTSAVSNAYTLTDAGSSYSILHVFNDTDDGEVKRAPSSKWMTKALNSNDLTNDVPQWYDINGVDDVEYDPVVNFYPPPDGVYEINFDMKIKTTLAADSDVILVPWLPVVLRAQFLALDERGDDQGVSLEALDIQFRTALADAVGYDMALNEDENCWEVE